MTLVSPAGVFVVPPAGGKRLAFELIYPRNAGQLRSIQRAVRHRDVARGHSVPAVGGDYPALRGLVPAQRGDAGLEQGVAVQAEPAGNKFAVCQDPGGERVLTLWYVARLIETR